VRELAKQYDPFTVEAKWAGRWVEEPFKADPHSEKPPFCIVIPPPNITSNLHLGHAFENSIIDALIRFKRMQGFEALFQPGTDHAGISTQVQVEKALGQEGLDKHDLGREAFLARVWAWKEKYGGIIIHQLQRLGISADWTRTRFTMDEGLSRAVRIQFIQLYHEGLAYRGERIVNWDPVSQTVLSDLEVEREERPGKLYTLLYPLEEGGAIRIATVRPETIFADVAVAVHPEDARYQALIGNRARIPLTERFIPIIADEAVEQHFGTGALKITPAHDPLDFEIGERHGLPRPGVVGLDAKLVGELVPQRFRGMDRFEGREAVVRALQSEGYLEEVEDHAVALGLSQRTGVPVEPILSEQWFVNMDEMAKRVLEGLDRGEIEVFPERWEKVNRDWLENIRDWCVSRQLWWGHQIPAWYDAEGNIYVPEPDDPDLDPPDDPRYEGIALRQDEDVFDTWFSSNLWPFSTLGWPDTEDPFFKKFYPTSVLVTGYDILFFWVARMEMAGYAFTGRAPFKHVLLHGLVLDEQGRKMSKSKGNNVDPLGVIDEYGADALRFASTYASTGGQDIRWDGRRVEMGRNFNNKLWNAFRFAMMNLGTNVGAYGRTPLQPQTLADRWMVSRLQRAILEITRQLEAYDLGGATRTAYDFVWSEFCDWYLEAAKPALREGDARTREVLRHTLADILKLLHPIVPFITSELYEALGNEEQLGWEHWPQADEGLIDENAEAAFAHVQNAVAAVRNLRGEAGLSPAQTVPVQLSGGASAVVRENREVFAFLARTELVDRLKGASLAQVAPELTVRLPLEGLIDIEAWRARQEKRLGELEATAEKSRKKLANERFVQNAPAEVVAEERRRLAEAEALIEGLKASLAQLEVPA
jgi:valyl-tRNA synthetase